MISNFLFHRVYPERDRLWDTMDVKLFEKCIKYISKKYQIALIEDILSSDSLHSKNNFATIMFDDGYKDNLEYAAPILDKYNCKASFYIVTDCIEKNIPTWTYILEHSFQFSKKTIIKLDFNFLPNHLKTTRLERIEEKIEYISKLKPFIKNISHEERAMVMEEVIRSFDDVKMPELMLNWNDLKELKNAGHYIGSHTVSHYMLGTMTNETDIRNELVNSAEAIKKNIGHFPLSISYPVGSFNNTTKRISKEAGYKIGLAVKQNIYDPVKDDIFEVPELNYTMKHGGRPG